MKRQFGILIVTFAIGACGTDGPKPPSRDDLVGIARSSVIGKTYDETVTRHRTEEYTEESRVSCSQYDYDTDPRKGDPNAGKCRGTGGTFGFGYKTVRRLKTKEVPYEDVVTRPCRTPPPVSSSAWIVSEVGNDRWKVTDGQGIWIVTQSEAGRLVAVSRQEC